MANNFWQKLKKPILALAPMAGITDSAFRQICKKFGADVVYTEMVSADGLYYNSKKTLEFLKFDKKEKPVVIQLFGKHPEKFIKAATLCEQIGFSGIDINFGCPARKVAAHGGGVTLMRDLEKCRAIIEAVLAGTKLPVSVKLRASIKKGKETITALDFIRAVKDLPLSALMIHGRSFEGLFSGPIDFKIIEAVKKEFKGIVLANGGINTPEDAKIMIEKTNADGLGLARGIRGKPYLFWQIKDYLTKGKYQELSQKEIKKIIIKHAKLAFASKGEKGIMELRKHLAWYITGWPGAKNLRGKLVRVDSVEEIQKILKQT